MRVRVRVRVLVRVRVRVSVRVRVRVLVRVRVRVRARVLWWVHLRALVRERVYSCVCSPSYPLSFCVLLWFFHFPSSNILC